MVLGEIIQYIASNPSLLVVGFLLYVFIFALSLFFSGPKPSGRNPFSATSVKPPRPTVLDQKLRDRILKTRFKPDRVPRVLDAIVIGSGPGGLSTAVLLAKAGKTVLVLEQHDQAGGTSHTFYEHGFEFDTGIHYVGIPPKSQLHTLSDELTNGQLVWEKMEEEFDVVAMAQNSKVHMYPRKSDKESYMADLISKFPKDKDGIEKFFKLLSECWNAMYGVTFLKFVPKWLARLLIKTGIVGLMFPSYWKYSDTTLQEVLDDVTADKDLQILLCYIFGDYGLQPEICPFMLHAAVMNHYMKGSYYPRGGTSEIALQMIRVIDEHGGRVLVEAPVSQILINSKGRAHGVRVHKKSGDIDLFAKTIISDAGAANTFTKLLPTEIGTKSCIYQALKKVGDSGSYITVFVGLKGSKDDLGLKANNTWAFYCMDVNESMRELDSISAEEAIERGLPVLFISFPSAKHSAWHEKCPDKSMALVITSAKFEWFEKWDKQRVKHRGEDYEDLKTRMGRQMWEQALKIYPHLEDKEEYFEVGSPITNKYYLGGQKGEFYGLDHSRRFLPDVVVDLRPKTDVPGLYLTGQDILSCGFAAVLYTSVFCASAILHRKLYDDLKTLHKKVKENQL